MASRVLIAQSNADTANTLTEFFAKRGDAVWQTTTPTEILPLLEQHTPDLFLVDIHLPGDEWLMALREARLRFPNTHVILTNRTPDFRRELLAKEQGVRVFLREPFEPEWIERALKRLRDQSAPPPPDGKLPPVRTPVRVKITFPFILLALAFALASAYLISRYVLESIRDRFTNQLIEVGQQSADWMVQEENRLLGTLRLLANVQGMADAITAEDDKALRDLALPIAVNAREEAIEILNRAGVSVLSLRHRPEGGVGDYDFSSGEDVFAEWAAVQNILAEAIDQEGDKYAELARAEWGDYFYVAGPVFDATGQLAGVVLVGKTLDTLTGEIRQDTLAQTTFYARDGGLLASTLSISATALSAAQVTDIAARQAAESWTHEVNVASLNYTEIVGVWRVRNGDAIGLMGAALSQNFLARPTLFTNLQAFLIVMIAVITVLGIGLYTANHITQPLMQMVRASTEVARGNFEVKVTPTGDDEVAVMAHAFNYMITGLQEGAIYRDILGRTVSPEVREELRESFASGDLKLEGQTAIATILMSDIRGFTTLSEHVEPTTILAWLNEYFGELVPVITARGGVVDKFEGDAILAVFGVLPRPLAPEESAYQACRAAVDLLRVVRRLNARRQARGEPLFVTGIGVNTGPVTAGGLGTADRLNYTVIGDAVNTTQRLESFTREFGESGAIVSQHTYLALGARQAEFRLATLGAHTFKGKSEPLEVYRLWASRLGREAREAEPEAGQGL